MPKRSEPRVRSHSEGSSELDPENPSLSDLGKAEKKRKSAPAESEKLKKATKHYEGENSEKILTYLKVQNRPYSIQNIFDNLHGEIQKAVMQRSLDQLVDAKKVICKEYGKFKVYLFEQSQLGAAKSDEELEEKRVLVSKRKESLEENEAQLKFIKAEISKIEAAAHRHNRIAQLKMDIKEGNVKLEQMRLNQPKDYQNQMQASKQTLENHRLVHEAWNKTKKTCMSLVSAVAQMSESKLADTMEELGIERDEDCLQTCKLNEGILV